MFGLIKKWFSNTKVPAMIEPGATIVDVRSPGEFNASHIRGAVNIPLEQLQARHQELKDAGQILLYCRSGNRSAHAKKILLDSGLHHIYDGGGLQDVAEMLGAAGMDNSFVTDDVSDEADGFHGPKDTEVVKVLIPTDFSQQAEFASIMAVKLSEKLNIEIHYLHVLEVPETVTLDDKGEILTCGEIDPDYLLTEKQKALESLDGLRNRHSKDAVTHFVMGKLTDTITSFAAEKGIDLIIMGTKGAWGLKEKISGSESQHVARKSEVPLLTLMCDRSDLLIREILVVHDYHEEDSNEIPLLEKFRAFFNVGIHQLYVDTSGKDNHDSIRGAMEAYAQKHAMANCTNHIVSAPDVEKGVLQFLENQDADILFIGTHGKGGVFHSNAAEKLVNHLFKPIITYHI